MKDQHNNYCPRHPHSPRHLERSERSPASGTKTNWRAVFSRMWGVLCLLFIVSQSCFAANAFSFHDFEPKLGDLLFQELNCGQLCQGIDKVTYGVDNTVISHVAMVIDATPKHQQVIEALSPGVEITPLATFLKRNLDQNGRPRVLVGRLTPEYQALIPPAVAAAKRLVGKPYNPSFMPHSKGYYCSQLIVTVFKQANHGHTIFVSNPMNFNDPNTGKLVPAWADYFKELHVPPPQGVMGTNPGALSRAPIITIVHHYGSMSQHDTGTAVRSGDRDVAVTVQSGVNNFSVGVSVFHSQLGS